MLSSFFSAVADTLLPVAYAEEQPKDVNQAAQEAQQDGSATKSSSDDDSAEAADDTTAAAAEGGDDEEEEEDEEEPEDTAPAIRDECEKKQCHSVKHHFEECAGRVSSGKVLIENEDCVEELFHLMHCVDDCAASKVFATLK